MTLGSCRDRLLALAVMRRPGGRHGLAQAKEHVRPLPSYRTGPYAPSGTPVRQRVHRLPNLLNSATAASTASS